MAEKSEAPEGSANRLDPRFVWMIAAIAAIMAALPVVLATGPVGTRYIGYVYNTDDHMVYAAWIRQAMEGRFLFDNRFAVDSQPGLTFHLYFLLLGWLAKAIGIVAATTIARIGFGILAIILMARLIDRLDWTIHAKKLALTLATFGAGLGFLVWHNFGIAIVRDVPGPLKDVMLSRLPTDVWQPEGFFFSSILTNGLFTVSLCLILFVFECVLRAEDSWKPVLPGAAAFAVLMNIHSYDALLVALALFGLLVMMWARDRATGAWVGRSFAIGAGAILPALWFVYVLRNDAVFQARAATETYSPNFRQILFGYLPLMLLAVPMLAQTKLRRRRALRGVAIFGVLIATIFVLAAGHSEGYFLSTVAWVVLAFAMVGILYHLAGDDATRNLLIAWALMGLAAIYFPALFQRKLTMGLAIPWAILAAGGIAILLAKQERSARNLASALCILLLSATSVRWLFREFELQRSNVSNTTVHPAFLSPDSQKIIDSLAAQPGRKVVLSLPGVPSPAADATTGQPVVDTFLTPIVPDLNPILSGFSGAYSYAGHWSETPDYNRRRGLATSIFIENEAYDLKREKLNSMGVNWLVMPEPSAFPELPLVDLSPLGEKVYTGTQFSLIRL